MNIELAIHALETAVQELGSAARDLQGGGWSEQIAQRLVAETSTFVTELYCQAIDAGLYKEGEWL